MIHKLLSDVPEGPIVLNCATPTEKESELLDVYLKPRRRNGDSYTRDTSYFLEKNLKNSLNTR